MKLITDMSIKTACSYNNIVYKQIDGVFLGLSLRLVLVNIIMADCLPKKMTFTIFFSGLMHFMTT